MNGVIGVLDRWSTRVSRWLYAIGVYGGLPALVVLVTTDVVLRYFFNAPIRWVRDVNGLLLMIALFSALPHAWDRGFHIRMELFYDRFGGGARRAANVLSALCGILFFGLLAAQSFRFAPYMAATGETGEDLMLPMWPFMAFMGACGLVFVARLVANPQGARPDGSEEVTREWI